MSHILNLFTSLYVLPLKIAMYLLDTCIKLTLICIISPRASRKFNHVVEAKRFEGVSLCRKVC